MQTSKNSEKLQFQNNSSHNVQNDLSIILISYPNTGTSCLWNKDNKLWNSKTEKSVYVLLLLKTSIHTPCDGSMTTTHMQNTNRFTIYCSKEYNPSYLHRNHQSAKQWSFNTIYWVLTVVDDIWTRGCFGLLPSYASIYNTLPFGASLVRLFKLASSKAVTIWWWLFAM